jgi:hypothetical protein
LLCKSAVLTRNPINPFRDPGSGALMPVCQTTSSQKDVRCEDK